MKKRYIFGAIGVVIVIFFLASVLFGVKDDEFIGENSMMPRIGQKLWTYNMNKQQWREYNERDDDLSKDEIILQNQEPVGNGGYTSYKLLTGNAQVPKEDVWVGEGSWEFLSGDKLYSYFPKCFEYYEIIFNGVKFVPRKLSEDEIKNIFKGYEIIKVSELQKGTMKISLSKGKNKFVIINDVGGDFYKYYVVPNDSKRLQLGDYSNQFTVQDKTTIKVQRLEGCSKNYPCYEIVVE